MHDAQDQRTTTPTEHIVQNTQYTAGQIVQKVEHLQKAKKSKKRACNLKNTCYNQSCQGTTPHDKPQKKFFKNLQKVLDKSESIVYNQSCQGTTPNATPRQSELLDRNTAVLDTPIRSVRPPLKSLVPCKFNLSR